MDDVKLNELSEGAPILAYKKFFGNKIYKWEHLNKDIFDVPFKVKDITLSYGGGYRVWCEILTLNYRGEKKINTSKMNLLQLIVMQEHLVIIIIRQTHTPISLVVI